MPGPRLEDYPDGYAWAAAFAIWNHAAWVESIREACHTAHQFTRYETALNVEAAQRGEFPPFLWCVRCRCHFDVPYPADVHRGPWWRPGEGVSPDDLSAIVNGTKALRAPKGSRARAEALAAWEKWTTAEAERQIAAEDARATR